MWLPSSNQAWLWENHRTEFGIVPCFVWLLVHMMTQAAFLVCRTPGWLAVVSCPPVLFHFEEDMVFPLASSRVYSAMDGTNLDGGSCTWVPFDTHLRRYLSLGSVGVEMLEKRMDWFLVHISDSSKKIFSHFPPISRYFFKKKLV